MKKNWCSKYSITHNSHKSWIDKLIEDDSGSTFSYFSNRDNGSAGSSMQLVKKTMTSSRVSSVQPASYNLFGETESSIFDTVLKNSRIKQIDWGSVNIVSFHTVELPCYMEEEESDSSEVLSSGAKILNNSYSSATSTNIISQFSMTSADAELVQHETSSNEERSKEIVYNQNTSHISPSALCRRIITPQLPVEQLLPEMISGRFAYIIKKYLGGGAFGRVFLAEIKSSKEKVVAKFLPRESWNVPDEVEFMKQLKHSNIVEFRDLSMNATYITIIMGCHGNNSMSLGSYRQKLNSFSETMLCFISNQILNGVEYIHAQSIAHMDLKDENIIINEKLEIKIIDFGISINARDPDYDECYFNGFSTVKYMSPETRSGVGFYGREADIWAFGVTIYRLFTGMFPFSYSPYHQYIVPAKLLYRPITRRCSRSLKRFFACVFDRHIFRRITASQALNHSWQQNAIPTYIKEEYYQPFFLQQ